jgi:hypothetical protein
VAICTVSNTWNEPISVTTSTSARTGRSSGSVTVQNIFHSLAPSSAAAA